MFNVSKLSIPSSVAVIALFQFIAVVAGVAADDRIYIPDVLIKADQPEPTGTEAAAAESEPASGLGSNSWRARHPDRKTATEAKVAELDRPEQKEADKDPDYIEEVPPGFHRMSDGSVMANNPAKAVAPPGYKLTAGGILVRENALVDASAGPGGMLMAEYKYTRMYMRHFLDATKEVTPTQIISDYPYAMTPTDMTMDMHMLMLMYHTRSYMVMLMGHYMSNTMGMLGSDLSKSTMANSGVADTLVTCSFSWLLGGNYTLGLSIPTGSIDVHGPMQHAVGNITDTKYPYGMQLGSGTWDVLFGVDFESDGEGFLGIGAGASYLLRNGANKNDYTLGDRIKFDTWLRGRFTDTFSARVDLNYLEIGQIEGRDVQMDVNMSPTADANNYGGRRLDLGLGVRYETPLMTSVQLDFHMPVYQNLWGPQMKTDWIANLSLGYMF